MLPELEKGRRMLFLAWVVVIAVSALFNIYNTMGSTEEVAKAQARAIFSNIVLTRSWNARHGGVYVPITEKSPAQSLSKSASS